MAHKPLKTVTLALDITIAACVVLMLAILLTGGFKLHVFGASVGATHLYTPLAPFLLLVAIRLFVTLKRADFLLLTLSIGIGLGAAELAVRIWDPPIAKRHMQQIHQSSFYMDWALVPGASGVGALGESYHINADGYRGTRRPIAKQADRLRLVVLGDSFTFGMGVDLENTYPKQLESILNRNGTHADVLNFGVIGYDMWQNNEMLSRKALAYQADIIILALYQNDIKHPSPPYQTDPNYQPHNPFAPWAPADPNGIINRSALWNLLSNVNARIEYKYRYLRGHDYLRNIPRRKQQWGTEQSGSKDYQILTGTFDQNKTQAFSRALGHFVNTARNAGAKVLIAYIPDSIQLNDPNLQVVNRQIAEWTRTFGVPFLDLTPVLEQEPAIESLYLFPFDAHNSPKGLALIAQALADKLYQLKYLEGSHTADSR